MCFVVVVRQNFRLLFITKYCTDWSVSILAYSHMLSRSKDNKNVDKQKHNADLNERGLLHDQRFFIFSYFFFFILGRAVD